MLQEKNLLTCKSFFEYNSLVKIKFQWIFSFVFLLFLLFLQVDLYSKEESRIYLEKGYSIEKENSEEAIKYYKKALELGLPEDLQKVALWRMYFILKNNNKYIQAWDILSTLNPKESVQNKFFEELEDYVKIKREDFLTLYSFLKNNDHTRVKSFFEKSNVILKKQILDYYSNNKNDKLISEFLDISSESKSLDTQFFLVDYYLEDQNYEKAKRILENISEKQKENLTDEQKAMILYLLGKIHREKNMLDSALYFLYATNYSQLDSDYEKNLSLALFSFYRSGYENIAYELVDYIFYEPKDIMQKLFILLLKSEKNPNKKNIKELRTLLKEIQTQNFLTEKARKLVSLYKDYE